MFRQLLKAGMSANDILTTYRPSQLSEYLEAVWASSRQSVRQAALGPNLTEALHRRMARTSAVDTPLPPVQQYALSTGEGLKVVWWHHLIYAYMLENTRMVDIFRRVMFEWVTGERVPLPREATQHWLHVTEQLFFSFGWPYSIHSITSQLRPDSGAIRRNAYYRMFGMDLNHGTDDGQVYPYVKTDVANRDFASVFEALLSEVWRGYANRTTLVAENLTDDSAMTELIRRLREMLLTRRTGGALSREEFNAVAMLSWFHLTVESDTFVVEDLNARAQGEADRLIRIGERVGLPAQARSDAYFQLAEPMSNVLVQIEGNPGLAATELYTPAGFLTQDMLKIITHWSVATGRNIKDPTTRLPVSTTLRQIAPVGPVATTAPSGNGGRIGTFIR